MDKKRNRELLQRAGGVEDREEYDENGNVLEPGLYNGVSNTAGGITTPGDQEHMAATDPISNVVEDTIDNIRKDFTNDEHIDERKH